MIMIMSIVLGEETYFGRIYVTNATQKGCPPERSRGK